MYSRQSRRGDLTPLFVQRNLRIPDVISISDIVLPEACEGQAERDVFSTNLLACL